MTQNLSNEHMAHMASGHKTKIYIIVMSAHAHFNVCFEVSIAIRSSETVRSLSLCVD